MLTFIDCRHTAYFSDFSFRSVVENKSYVIGLPTYQFWFISLHETKDSNYTFYFEGTKYSEYKDVYNQFNKILSIIET